MANTPDLGKMSVADLRTLAAALEIQSAEKLKKPDLISAIETVANSSEPASNVTETIVNEDSQSVKSNDKPNGKRKRISEKSNNETNLPTAVENQTENGFPLTQESSENSAKKENRNFRERRNKQTTSADNTLSKVEQKANVDSPVDQSETSGEKSVDSDVPHKKDRHPNQQNRHQNQQRNDRGQHVHKQTEKGIENTEQSEKPQPPKETEDEKRKREILAQLMEMEGVVFTQGVLETVPDGYGFLRSPDYNYMASPDDVYVPGYMIKQNGLKVGDTVKGSIRPPKDNEKYFCLVKIESVNGKTPEEVRDRVAFEHLTPLFPDEKLNLCDNPKNYPNRIIDLVSPIGKGQRGLIVAQPKTGKTWLLKGIANAIAANHPEVYMIVLLIDERPEEVTDMARSVRAEVVASTFDEPADKHVKLTNMVLEKAKRLVECGHDVVILLIQLPVWRGRTIQYSRLLVKYCRAVLMPMPYISQKDFLVLRETLKMVGH